MPDTEIKTTTDEHGRIFYDIGDAKLTVNEKPRPKGIMKQPIKRGDRNFYQEQRLKGRCPVCRMIVPCVQTVDRHKDFGLVKHYCKYCNKVLRVQRYPLMSLHKFQDYRSKKWV